MPAVPAIESPRFSTIASTFWREHGEVLAVGLSYHEVAPQLVLLAFLQRVINGGGFVDREYGAAVAAWTCWYAGPIPKAASGACSALAWNGRGTTAPR